MMWGLWCVMTLAVLAIMLLTLYAALWISAEVEE